MGVLIAIGKFFLGSLKFAVGLVKSGAFWITAAVSSGIAAIGWCAYKLWDQIDFFTDLLVNTQARIESYLSWLNSFDCFALLYNTLALDYLFKSLFSLFSLGCLLVGFVLVDMVIAGIITFSTFLAWRVQSKILAAFTAGMVKT